MKRFSPFITKGATSGGVTTRAARRVLVTGQAGHEDTIRAINEAELDHYVAKPWDPEEFRAVVREQLTDFVLTKLDVLTGLEQIPVCVAYDVDGVEFRFLRTREYEGNGVGREGGSNLGGKRCRKEGVFAKRWRGGR